MRVFTCFGRGQGAFGAARALPLEFFRAFGAARALPLEFFRAFGAARALLLEFFRGFETPPPRPNETLFCAFQPSFFVVWAVQLVGGR